MSQQRFIDKIKIAGFKSIRELTFPLGRLNILIGANGAGKSNFIGVFELLKRIRECKLQSYVGQRCGADFLLHYGRKVTHETNVEISFGTDGYGFALISDDSDGLLFGYEQYWYLEKRPHCFKLGEGHRESKLENPPDREQLVPVCFQEGSGIIPDDPLNRCYDLAGDILKILKELGVYHFHDTSENSPMKQTTPIADNRSLKSDASNLAAFLYFLKQHHKNNYTEIVKIVRLVAPFFSDFLLEPVPGNHSNIRLEWRDTKSDAYFNANMLSDGTLRFICLATLLLQPEPPSVIILDEPELGLHPAAIALLAEMLKSASHKAQIIVSTQSVTLINHFAPEDIIVTERKPDTGESLFKRLEKKEIEQWLEDYALGVIWEKNIIGGRP